MAISDSTGHDYSCNCAACLVHWEKSDAQVDSQSPAV